MKILFVFYFFIFSFSIKSWCSLDTCSDDTINFIKKSTKIDSSINKNKLKKRRVIRKKNMSICQISEENLQEIIKNSKLAKVRKLITNNQDTDVITFEKN